MTSLVGFKNLIYTVFDRAVNASLARQANRRPASDPHIGLEGAAPDDRRYAGCPAGRAASAGATGKGELGPRDGEDPRGARLSIRGDPGFICPCFDPLNMLSPGSPHDNM